MNFDFFGTLSIGEFLGQSYQVPEKKLRGLNIRAVTRLLSALEEIPDVLRYCQCLQQTTLSLCFTQFYLFQKLRG